MRDIMGMMKQAQALQAKMQAVQAELEQLEVEGASGGGLVKVRMSAKGELKGVTIDPSLLKEDEREIIEDLIVAAHADARAKGEKVSQEKLGALTAGLPLPPGMKLPF
ncbi:MAG: YbaB/EbfC family nucleoid-associated protein [Labrys sp. (in: a-proteobacteria)]|jgi:DNA-binding YbaB/EbfC family protein